MYDTVESLFEGICEAVRTKTGSTAPILHQDLPALIENISTEKGDTLLSWYDYLLNGSDNDDILVPTCREEQIWQAICNGKDIDFEPETITEKILVAYKNSLWDDSTFEKFTIDGAVKTRKDWLLWNILHRSAVQDFTPKSKLETVLYDIWKNDFTPAIYTTCTLSTQMSIGKEMERVDILPNVVNCKHYDAGKYDPYILEVVMIEIRFKSIENGDMASYKNIINDIDKVWMRHQIGVWLNKIRGYGIVNRTLVATKDADTSEPYELFDSIRFYVRNPAVGNFIDNYNRINHVYTAYDPTTRPECMTYSCAYLYGTDIESAKWIIGNNYVPFILGELVEV